MAIHDLKGQIARLPEQPGVYVFVGAAGETLYVGKAAVLRDRVRSYLGSAGASPRLDALARDAASLEFVVTDSVVEALALENRLIKQRNPRFNVLLRDDKTYPYLQLTTTESAPRLLVARRVERDGNVYAGPFMPAALARRTMALSHRLFGIRSCNEVIDGKRGRPCLEYDIGRCLAPCVESICTIDRYRRAVDQTQLLLEGNQDELTENLRAEMVAAADANAFERAAHLRDAVRTIENLRDRRNKIEAPAMGDRDVFGVKVGSAGAVVQVFQVRHGRVVERIQLTTEGVGGRSAPLATSDPLDEMPRGRSFSDLTSAESPDTEADLLCIALPQFYADREAPAEIHLPVAIASDEQEAVESWLSKTAGTRVRILVPQRGDKRGLVELANRNAAMAYQAQFGEASAGAFDALDTLRGVLHLPALPRRIECFDISTLQGRETVAALVVAVDGRMRPSEYRKFRVRGTTVATPAAAAVPPRVLDDFASMHEVVLRRYRRVLEHGGPFPDLILIDGGKGQLHAAYDALREVGLERLMAAGLAKEEELLFVRDRADGILLPRESAALHLVQRIRDEAHRFAVTFHRRRRTTRDLRSELDDIHGVGPRRRRQLLISFGSLAGVRRASRDALVAVVGAKVADALLKHFNG